MIRNLIEYMKDPVIQTGLFLTNETGALKKGFGMCFDLGYYTSETGEAVTDNFGARGMKFVAKPASGNNMAFAGVLTQDYPAMKSNSVGPRQIELALPGGCAEIAVGIATTINSTRLSCLAGSGAGGLFIAGALPGRGMALALQTKAAGAGKVIGSSLDGTAAYTTASKTVTKTGLFANAAVGDKVIVVAGEGATVGTYTIVTKTSNDAVIVDSAITATSGGKLAVYVISGNPTVLAYLYDGDESGLVEYVTPTNSGSTAAMVGGYTIAMGGITIANDDVPPLAAGLFIGMKKAYTCTGTITTGDYLVTPAAAGVQLDGATALNTLELDGASDLSILEWNGLKWQLKVNSGTALA
jgi:hypothetical protein